jgi:hypothetical protein
MPKQATIDSPALLWPPALRRPASPPTLVYLDLNHWIYLAHAATGHRNGSQYEPALRRCRAARADGTALFPLSATHYMEIAKISDPAQRSDLAGLMEELSGFTTLLSRSWIIRMELAAALTSQLGSSPDPPPRLDLLGPGYGWTLGRLHPIVLSDAAGNDITEQARQQSGPAAFDAYMTAMLLITERAMLAGPADEDVPALRSLGWDPLAAKTMAANRARQEQAFQDGLDEHTRRRPNHLRNIVLAREVIIELEPMLVKAATSRDCSLDDLLGSCPRQAQDLVRSMPSSEVATTLKFQDHRNRSKRWAFNDIFDIDALSIAVPYCDVVVTDTHRRSVLHTVRVDERMDTVVLARLTELPEHL